MISSFGERRISSCRQLPGKNAKHGFFKQEPLSAVSVAMLASIAKQLPRRLPTNKRSLSRRTLSRLAPRVPFNEAQGLAPIGSDLACEVPHDPDCGARRFLGEGFTQGFLQMPLGDRKRRSEHFLAANMGDALRIHAILNQALG